MPAVLIAMCTPSRSDQAPTKAATSHCREFGASPATGHNAAPAPTKPTENVQMVSTQPELPVRCCTTQAPIIKIESEAAMATSAPKYEIACMTVQPLVLPKLCRKYAPDPQLVSRTSSRPGVSLCRNRPFISVSLCHSVVFRNG